MTLIKRMIGQVSGILREENPAQGRNRESDSYKERLERQYKKLRRLLLDITKEDLDDGACSVFQSRMRECYFKWREVNGLKDREAQANLVLTGYYASEKIRSKFQDFVEYVEGDMEEEVSSEDLVTAGYNSCMNLARIDFKRMQEQFSGQQADPMKIRKQEALMGFLQMLAYKNSFFSDLYTAYVSGTKREQGENIKETDKELYSLLKKVNLSIARYEDEPKSPLFDPILEELKLQKSKIAESVTEADKIKAGLTQILSDQNMSLLSNREEKLETLKQQYREVGELVRKFL